MSTKRSDQPKQPVCVPKILPSEELRIRAHENAAKIEPKNHTHLNNLLKVVPNLKIPVARLVVMTQRKWPKEGKKFTVGFLDNPEQALRKKILLHMNAWNKTANVSFVEASDPEVRIARLDGKEGGFWSYLGTEILEIDKDAPTMNFEGFTVDTIDSEFHRVVRHETGHTMGFPHEHMRRELVDRIDREKAIKEFMASQGWSREEVIAQVLTPLEEADIQGTSFSDENSIMCYQISGDITKDGKPILGGTDIDDEDYKFAARVYPKPTKTTESTGQDMAVSFGTTATAGESNSILLEYFRATRALIGALPTSNLGRAEERSRSPLGKSVAVRRAAISDGQAWERVVHCLMDFGVPSQDIFGNATFFQLGVSPPQVAGWLNNAYGLTPPILVTEVSPATRVWELANLVQQGS